MSLRLLISAAGTGTAFGYAQAKARWFPDIALFTGDIHPAEQVTASLFAEQHLLMPESMDESYFPVLEDFLRMHSIDAYIPLIDGEVAQAAALRAALPAKAACNSKKFCEAAMAKSRYAEWFAIDGALAPP